MLLLISLHGASYRCVFQCQGPLMLECCRKQSVWATLVYMTLKRAFHSSDSLLVMPGQNVFFFFLSQIFRSCYIMQWFTAPFFLCTVYVNLWKKQKHDSWYPCCCHFSKLPLRLTERVVRSMVCLVLSRELYRIHSAWTAKLSRPVRKNGRKVWGYSCGHESLLAGSSHRRETATILWSRFSGFSVCYLLFGSAKFKWRNVKASYLYFISSILATCNIEISLLYCLESCWRFVVSFLFQQGITCWAFRALHEW